MFFLRCKSASPIEYFVRAFIFYIYRLAPFLSGNSQGKIKLFKNSIVSVIHPIPSSRIGEGYTHQTLVISLFYLGVTQLSTLRRRVKLFLDQLSVYGSFWDRFLLFSFHLKKQKLQRKLQFSCIWWCIKT